MKITCEKWFDVDKFGKARKRMVIEGDTEKGETVEKVIAEMNKGRTKNDDLPEIEVK